MTTTMNKTPTTESDSVRQRLRLRDVALYGLAAQDDALLAEPWIERVIDIEDRERKRRSLERRLTNARIGAFKPIADFDWAWPKRIDRPLIEELFSLAFVDDATNVVLVGPNGVGEPFMEFTFHAFEVLAREGSGSKRIDLSTQSFECLGRSCISAGRHTRDMKY